MADEEAGDTDRIFPPFPESAVVERAIPIGPSIRQEFINHRRHVDFALMAFAEKLDAALERMAPEVTPASIGRKVASGALAGGKYGALIVGVLGILATIAKLWRPSLAGPIDTIQQVLTGQ